MPLYDYRCQKCETVFEARHAFSESAPPCPACGSANVQRLITSAPAQMKGMSANAGSSRSASKEELRSKWSEETPKLRDQLVSKLGEDTVRKNAPSLFSE
ncbi:MAG: Zinc ribbon domain protein [Chloroflexi bacterium OLB15]|nr:MAG: Zinc ribbon domain protein [Chloroflexi bacterium OLB15]